MTGAVPGRLRAGRAGGARARVARRVHAAAGQRALGAAGAGPAGPRRRARAALARVPGAAVVPAPAHARHAAAGPHRARRPGAAAARPARARPPHARSARPTSRSPSRRPPNCSRCTASRSPERLVHALHARTEGWSAGLRLAALSLQGRDDPEAFVAAVRRGRPRGRRLPARRGARPPAAAPADVPAADVDRRARVRWSGRRADRRGERGAETLATLERTNGFVLGVDAHGEWFRYHRLFARLLRTRAEREIAARAAGPARPRGALVRRARARAGRARARGRGRGLGPRRRGRRRALVRSLRTRRRRRRARTRRSCSPPTACARTPSSRRRWPARRSTSATPTRRRSTSRTPTPRPAACPSRAGAGISRRWRSASLATSRLEGDFEGALAAADALLAEAAAHGGGSDEARQALVHALLGQAALWGHRLDRAREELTKAVTLARLNRLDYVSVSALSDLAMSTSCCSGRPATRRTRARRSPLASRRGWATIPQIGVRTPRSRWRRSSTCGRAWRPSTSSARPRRRRRCAIARWTS